MGNERETNERIADPSIAGCESMLPEEERELRDALQRVAAPAHFADRVMERIGNGETAGSRLTEACMSDAAPARRGTLLEFRRPVWRVAYAAAALLALTAGTLGVKHHRTEQRRVDAAAAQFDEAMQVTGHALDHVSAQLEQGELGAVERALEEGGGK